MDRRDVQHALWQDVDSGWAITAEFLSAVGVWFGIGWLLDRWLNTGPWLMALGAALGFGLGLYLAWLRLSNATREDHARFSYRGGATSDTTSAAHDDVQDDRPPDENSPQG